ncbi:MAG: hypothetical protein WCR08_08100 [Gammaproteobacteria bacterium]
MYDRYEGEGPNPEKLRRFAAEQQRTADEMADLAREKVRLYGEHLWETRREQHEFNRAMHRMAEETRYRDQARESNEQYIFESLAKFKLCEEQISMDKLHEIEEQTTAFLKSMKEVFFFYYREHIGDRFLKYIKDSFDKIHFEFYPRDDVKQAIKKAFYIRGLACFLQDNYVMALENLTQLIELDAKYEDALYQRGVTYIAQMENEKAVADFESVKKLNKNNGRALMYLAFRHQAWNEAIIFLNSFFVICPRPTNRLKARLEWLDFRFMAAHAELQSQHIGLAQGHCNAVTEFLRGFIGLPVYQKYSELLTDYLSLLTTKNASQTAETNRAVGSKKARRAEPDRIQPDELRQIEKSRYLRQAFALRQEGDTKNVYGTSDQAVKCYHASLYISQTFFRKTSKRKDIVETRAQLTLAEQLEREEHIDDSRCSKPVEEKSSGCLIM